MDRRTKYSIKVINDTVLELLKKKDLSKITVTELCEIADINRATFYKYYKDIYELVEKIEEKIYEEIKTAIENVDKTETIKPFVKSVINTINNNRDASKVLFGNYGNKEFIRKIIYLSYIKSATEWKHSLKNYSNKEIDFIFYFFAYGSIGIIEKWIIEDFEEPPEKIIDLIYQLCDISLNKKI